MHADVIRPGQRVLIVDDLLATGGTVKATIEMIEKNLWCCSRLLPSLLNWMTWTVVKKIGTTITRFLCIINEKQSLGLLSLHRIKNRLYQLEKNYNENYIFLQYNKGNKCLSFDFKQIQLFLKEYS